MPARYIAVGVAFSVAILVIGFFMFDGVGYMMDLQFRVIQREDLTVSFQEALGEDVRYELQRLPGVTRTELYRAYPARLRAGRVEINNPALDPNAPFGGFKQSGNGREWGAHGFTDFLEIKAVQGYGK